MKSTFWIKRRFRSYFYLKFGVFLYHELISCKTRKELICGEPIVVIRSQRVVFVTEKTAFINLLMDAIYVAQPIFGKCIQFYFRETSQVNKNSFIENIRAIHSNIPTDFICCFIRDRQLMFIKKSWSIYLINFRYFTKELWDV